MKSKVILILSCFLILTFSSHLYGEILPAVVETLEMMMEGMGSDAEFIGQYFGTDPGNILGCSFEVDPDNKSYSYVYDAGNSYLGESFSLSGSGSYDSQNSTWTGVSNGQIGQETWQSDWMLSILAADPFDGDFERVIQHDGKEYTLNRSVSIEWSTSGAVGLSTSTFSATLDSEIVYEGTATDNIRRTGPDNYEYQWKWEDGTTWNLPEPAVEPQIEGDCEPFFDTYIGIGSMQTPEPGTVLILGLGGLFLRRRKA